MYVNAPFRDNAHVIFGTWSTRERKRAILRGRQVFSFLLQAASQMDLKLVLPLKPLLMTIVSGRESRFRFSSESAATCSNRFPYLTLLASQLRCLVYNN